MSGSEWLWSGPALDAGRRLGSGSISVDTSASSTQATSLVQPSCRLAEPIAPDRVVDRMGVAVADQRGAQTKGLRHGLRHRPGAGARRASAVSILWPAQRFRPPTRPDRPAWPRPPHRRRHRWAGTGSRRTGSGAATTPTPRPPGPRDRCLAPLRTAASWPTADTVADSRRRRLSCQGVGQISMQAGMQKMPAETQPTSRGPMAVAGAATATGSTKISRAAVDPVAAWGERIPAKSTAKPDHRHRHHAPPPCASRRAVPRTMKQTPTRKRPR